MKYLTLLYAFLLVTQNAQAQSNSFGEFLERLRQKNEPKKEVKIIERRLNIEMTLKKQTSVSNVTLGLRRLAQLDKIQYDIFIKKIPNAALFKGADAASQKLFSDLLDEVASKQSAADALQIIMAGSNAQQEIYLVSFVSKIVSSGRIKDYMVFFDANEESLAKLPNLKFRSLLEYYCEIRYLNENRRCIEKLDKYSVKFMNPQWISFVKAVVYLGDGDVEKSLGLLKQINSAEIEKCTTEVKDVPWFHFLAAQALRLRGETDKSKKCLQKFKEIVTYDLAIFFHALESARLERQTGEMVKANQFLKSAAQYITQNRNLVHQLLYDLEFLKNSAASKEKIFFFENVTSFRKRVNDHGLIYFSPVIGVMEKAFVVDVKSMAVPKDNFETLDFKTQSKLTKQEVKTK